MPRHTALRVTQTRVIVARQQSEASAVNGALYARRRARYRYDAMARERCYASAEKIMRERGAPMMRANAGDRCCNIVILLLVLARVMR